MKDVKLPSDRSIGVLFSVVCALLAGWAYYKGSHWWKWLAAGSGAFLLVGLLVPIVLRPLNWVWMRLGLILGMIISPIVLGIIYFVVITPVALFFKIKGRDALSRKYDAKLASYWVHRDPPGPDGPSSFPRQF
jgi:hypothetical protein